MTGFSFPSFPPAPLPPLPKGTSQRVIVVGAGLSGLSAAQLLRDSGREVVVLEARDRPGGRILTLREGFSHGLHADAGAAFMPGGHTYTIGYIQHFGLELDLIPPGPTVPVDYLAGQRVSDTTSANAQWPVPLSASEQGKTPMDWERACAGAAMGRLLAVDPRAPDWPGSVTDLDAVSFAGLLAQNGASPGAIRVLRLGYSDLWGDGVDSVSALLILRDMAWMVAIAMSQQPPAAAAQPAAAQPAMHRAMRQHHARQAQVHRSGRPSATIDPMSLYRIRGGSDRLPRAFADSLESVLTYNAPVQAIAQDEGGVRVTLDSGRVVEGDRAIVTAPYSCVRRMQFAPALPAAKAAVVEQLRYTSVTRVFLEFRERTWTAGGFNGTAATDLPEDGPANVPGIWMEDATQTQHTRAGILDCYYVGDWARRVGAMAEDERARFTLEQVERVFPGAAAAYSGRASSKVWDDDPWARGDYCWFAPGEMAAFSAQLAAPAGRVHFAGCHTSALPAWIQGAFESGVRAASEVASA